jgi:hypothetical protein
MFIIKDDEGDIRVNLMMLRHLRAIANKAPAGQIFF